MDTVETLIYFSDGTLYLKTEFMTEALEAIETLLLNEEEFYVEYQ